MVLNLIAVISSWILAYVDGTRWGISLCVRVGMRRPIQRHVKHRSTAAQNQCLGRHCHHGKLIMFSGCHGKHGHPGAPGFTPNFGALGDPRDIARSYEGSKGVVFRPGTYTCMRGLVT